MPATAIVFGEGPCEGDQPLLAFVTVTIIEEGDNAGCAQIEVENAEFPFSTGFIGALCLTVDNQGDFTQISGPGTEGPLSGGNCPGGCLDNSDIIQMFAANQPGERINPGETGTFIICSGIDFTEEQFESVALHFQGIAGCPENNNSECVMAMFDNVTTTTSETTTDTTTDTTTETTTETTTDSTTTVCPIPNPQTCCQAIVEFKTQLVPPALASAGVTTRVFISQDPVIEDVCPEKVIICGKVTKEITYTPVEDNGYIHPEPVTISDQQSFQCFIDRDDANEGDPFELVGSAILCEGTPRLQNRGTRPGQTAESDPVDVFWKVVEKDAIKVCIRKIEDNGAG